jgi:hypothetical protein
MYIRTLLLFCALLAAAPLGAQPRPLGPGDVVRFSPSPQGVYTVQEARADSLVVTGRGGQVARVAVRGRVIRRASGPDQAGSLIRGAGFGSLIGVVAGAASASGDSEGSWMSAPASAAGLGLIGMAVGGVAGLLFPTREWEVAAAPSARASLVPTAPDGRPGVVLSVSF